MAFQLPDNVKGVQPINEATAVQSLDYPFYFLGYGASAGASAPLVSYSSANLRADIIKFISQVVGTAQALDEASAQALDAPQMVSAEEFFDRLSGATKRALVVVEFNSTSADVLSAVNSGVSQGELPISLLKQGNKSYIRIHTPILKSAVVDGSLSVMVESENPTMGECTIFWRGDDATEEMLDVTIRNYKCKLHISYLTPLTGGTPIVRA